MSRLKQIFLIFLAYYGITCLSNIYFIFGPFYEKMGASPQTIGFFLSIFYLMNCVCRPVGSAFMEKLNIRRTL
ncbi:MAG: MFS transporter, partial [Synergistes sp.]|nr:MFS transporter [Synergistes sp.]